MFIKNLIILILTVIIFSSCSNKNNSSANNTLDKKMNEISEQYVKQVLRAGQLDQNFVDAYYGPKEWEQKDVLNTKEDTIKVMNECNSGIDTLLNKLDALGKDKADEMQTLRFRFLYKQLLAVKAKLFMLKGGSFSFDDESRALYDAVSPSYPKGHYQEIIDRLNKILPGSGDITKRMSDFKKSFIIPKDKLDTVFSAAIHECRKRTMQHIQLPANENFKVEYVTGKPWGGYNWYKGNYFSVIQVNTDLPIYIDRAIDLAAHEGYPGHHVYNTLLEENMVKKRGWMEFTVYPLFSPQSLIAEGTANFGIQVVFPGESRVEFEKKVLFPLAGLDTSKADKYYEVQKLTEELSYAGNEAARNYLDGKWKKEATLKWLEKYSLMTPERASHYLSFINTYRSYVINYNLGQDLVKNFIVRHGGTESNPEKRWELFKYLLTTPQTPSGLNN